MALSSVTLRAQWRRARRTFWDIPYPVRYPLYRAMYGATTSIPEVVARRRNALAPFHRLDLNGIKRSDTVFLLGSGESINEISDARWQTIGQHDSIGFNLWFLHDFVPTLYTTYAFNPEEYPEELRQWGRGVLERMVEEAYKRADLYRDIPKLIMHVSRRTEEMVRRLPDGFRNRSYTVGTLPGLARNEDELTALLRYWDRRGAFQPQDRIQALFKYRASVTQLIALAIAMGYRRIVLCGIDVSHARYFYGDPMRYPHMVGFSSSPPQSSHATATRTESSLDIVTVVGAMRNVILRPKGIELFVENASSGLYPAVPVAPENVFTAAPNA